MAAKKHILFLTWKDIQHPHAGGAEQVMYEYAKGLSKKGYRITWFASSASGLPREEMIDGIRIIRRYSQNTVWLFGWWWYKNFKKTESIDFIIDEAGGWPLLSPLYEKNIPIIFFAHHIGDKEFDAFPWMIGRPAKWIYLSLFRLYKHIPTIAVSGSTKQELVEGFDFDERSITVIENTTELSPIKAIDWENKTNDILFLGRLTTIKRTEHAIRAFAHAKDKLPVDTKLSIIGNGQNQKYVDKLHALVNELGLNDRIVFHGYIDRADFPSIIARHRCILVPSEKEGFGLIVLEANAYGLPAIAYDVAGVRDSVVSGENGILVNDGDWKAMGEAIVELFHERKCERIAESSLDHARKIHGWKENVEKLENIIRMRLL